MQSAWTSYTSVSLLPSTYYASLNPCLATYVGCDAEHIFCKTCLDQHFAIGSTSMSAFDISVAPVTAFGNSAYLRESTAILQNSAATLEERTANFRHFRNGTLARCPLDRKVVNASSMKAAVFVARMIGDLKVKCPFCPWTGLAEEDHEFSVRLPYCFR